MTNLTDSTVSVINAGLQIVTATISVGTSPTHVAVTNTITPPTPPFVAPAENFKGKIVKKKKCNKIDRVARLTWDQSPDTSVRFYKILRNGKYIVTVPATPSTHYKYLDRHRKKHKQYIYQLIADTGVDSSLLVQVVVH